MRYIILLLLLPSLCFAGDWDREDTFRQTAFSVLLIADWGQTLNAAKDQKKFRETGLATRIIGEHPSVAEVNSYFVSSLIAHAAISYLLPSPWRKVWQYVWIGAETNQVYRNYQVGARINF